MKRFSLAMDAALDDASIKRICPLLERDWSEGQWPHLRDIVPIYNDLSDEAGASLHERREGYDQRQGGRWFTDWVDSYALHR